MIELRLDLLGYVCSCQKDVWREKIVQSRNRILDYDHLKSAFAGIGASMS